MDEMMNYLKIITKPTEAPKGSLTQALQKLDAILKDPTYDLHPRLKHFLENRSYEKALIWINGNEPEKGICSK
jgi:hypothetical protein